MSTRDSDGAAVALTQTVLVVDDEVLVRMVIAAYLRDCGYRVVEAASADEAMLVIEHDEEGAVGVVLSDVEMAGEQDGFALAQMDPRPPAGLRGDPGRHGGAGGRGGRRSLRTRSDARQALRTAGGARPHSPSRPLCARRPPRALIRARKPRQRKPFGVGNGVHGDHRRPSGAERAAAGGVHGQPAGLGARRVRLLPAGVRADGHRQGVPRRYRAGQFGAVSHPGGPARSARSCSAASPTATAADRC